MLKYGFYNEDCMEGMGQIDDGSIDLILCDLPYGKTHNRWDTVIPFEKLWESYDRIIKDNGAILLFGQEPFSSMLRISNLEMYRYDWIWQKTHPRGHLNAKKMPMSAHENISVFYKKLPTYNPQMTHGHARKTAFTQYVKEEDGNGCYGREVRNTAYDSTDRYPLSVQVFSSGSQTGKIHPTQKPVNLLEYLIKTYTNKGDVVLDNCAGSCSTGVAALHTGRNFIGFENDKEIYEKGYAWLIKERATYGR